MINLDIIKNNALLGIKRASFFLGFGINCAENSDIINYNLLKYSPIQFIPNNLNTDSIFNNKNEFKNWIISNSFRELTESFEFLLNNIFSVCIFFKEKNISYNNFEYCGISKKLEILNKEFNIITLYNEGFETINKARNCLTHRRGIVDNKDLNDDDCLLIKWTGFDIKTINPSGQDMIIKYPIDKQYFVEKDGKIVIQPEKRIKKLKINEMIKFEANELHEICFYFFNEINNIIQELVKFLENNNIQIIWKDKK